MKLKEIMKHQTTINSKVQQALQALVMILQDQENEIKELKDAIARIQNKPSTEPEQT